MIASAIPLVAATLASALPAILPDARPSRGRHVDRGNREGRCGRSGGRHGAVARRRIASAQRLRRRAAAARAAAAAAAAGQLRPFADVSGDAKEIAGPLPRCGRRTTRSGSRSRPSSSTSRYFFSTNLDQGLGENGFLAGSMAAACRAASAAAIVVLPQGRHQRAAHRART